MGGRIRGRGSRFVQVKAFLTPPTLPALGRTIARALVAASLLANLGLYLGWKMVDDKLEAIYAEAEANGGAILLVLED